MAEPPGLRAAYQRVAERERMGELFARRSHADGPVSPQTAGARRPTAQSPLGPGPCPGRLFQHISSTLIRALAVHHAYSALV